MAWTKEENDRFEQALAVIEEDNPERWELVALAAGGGKTAEDAWEHYLELNGDIDGMGAAERTARRRELYQHQANNSRRNSNRNRNDRRRSNGGEGSSRNSNNNNISRGNNHRASRPQA